jgi:8-oxo-dGTP pyrophosphatase MutT (NUDIX family)
MSVTLEEAERFRKHVEELYTAYLSVFPQEEARLARLKSGIERGAALYARTTMTGHVTASAYVLAPDGERVLLVYHRALEDWLAPGGHFEVRDGDLVGCARREAQEETGIKELSLDAWHERLGIPIDIDTHLIPGNALKGETEHYHFDCRYVFHAFTTAIRSAPMEVSAVEWRSLASIGVQESMYPVVQKIQRLLN